MATAIKPRHFPWFDYARYSFSLGVKAGQGAYLSGHTASRYDPDAGRIVVTGGMAEQARTAYAKIGAILEAADLSFSDVVRIVEYVRPEGIERYAEAAAVREEVFGAHRPAVDTAPVRSLLRPDAFIEIEATAGPRSAGQPGGVVFLPTLQPVDAQGDVVGKGDLAAQAQAIFEKAATMLAGLGLGLEHVVKTVDYLAPAALTEYGRAIERRRAFLGPVFPAAASFVMPRLLHADALLQCDVIAARETPTRVDPGWSRYAGLARSPGVRAGNLLFLSGQSGLDPQSDDVRFPGDVAAQAEYAYGNILQVVAAAGGGPQHLVKTIEYVTPAGLPRYREVAGVRSRLLREPWPASTGLVCDSLLRPELLLEIDPFAVLE